MPSEQIRQLAALIKVFWPDVSCLGRFVEVTADCLPDDQRQLLAHNRHMTTTLQTFHQSLISVEVLATASDGDRYCRQVLLRAADNHRIVQFAIASVDFRHVDAAIRREIELEGAPLGRILIDHDVSRNVVMMALWRIKPTPKLRQHLSMAAPATIFARTATIYCDGAPAIDLLEIPAPI